MSGSRWVKWFQPEGADGEEFAAALYKAREVLAAAESDWFKIHLEWLRKQADAPAVVTADHMAMIQHAVRSNTFKEVRSHLLAQIEKARNFIASSEGG